MNGESILKAFRDLFPEWIILSYKRLDPHSISIKMYHGGVENEANAANYIFIYYGPHSFKLETM